MAPSAIGRRAAILYPVVLAMLSMIGPFSIDTPFPAFADIQRDFGVGKESTQLLVSAYLISFGAMSVFHGPLSDALGRKPVMVGGMIGYVLASIGAAFAPSIAILIGCRVVQGLTAGGGVIVSRAMVRELYDGDQAQRMMSRIMMIFSLGPAIAPIIGGGLLQLGSWHIVFWFMAALGLVLAVLVGVALPETLPRERRSPLRAGALVGSLVTVLRTRAFLRVAWAGALCFGGQFLYIGSAAIVMVDLLGQSETDFWKLFAPLVAAIIAGSWISGRAAGRIEQRQLVTLGLSFAVVAAVLNLVFAGIPATRGLPWATLGPALVGLGVTACFPTQQLILLDMFPQARGAAASAATFITLMLNGVVAGALAPLVTGSLVTMATTTLVMVTAGYLLWRWHLRQPAQVRTVPVE